MARAIENTPILTGGEAKQFRLKLHTTICKELSPEEKEQKKKQMAEMKRDYEQLCAIANGQFY